MKSTVDSSSGEQFTAAEKVEFNNEILASSRTASATLGDKMISKANLELVRPVCENGGGDAAGGRIAVYQNYVGPDRCKNAAWCASFVSYIHNQATGNNGVRECYVPWLPKQGGSKPQMIDNSHKPQKGDIVINRSNGHTGAYVKSKVINNVTKYYSIEGNHHGSDNPKVCVMQVKRNASYWGSYIRP